MTSNWRLCWTDPNTGQERCREVFFVLPGWRDFVAPGPRPWEGSPSPDPWEWITPGLWDPPREAWLDDVHRLATIDRLAAAVRDDQFRDGLRETIRNAAAELVRANVPNARLNVEDSPF
jgi:hypothetical protein